MKIFPIVESVTVFCRTTLFWGSNYFSLIYFIFWKSFDNQNIKFLSKFNQFTQKKYKKLVRNRNFWKNKVFETLLPACWFFQHKWFTLISWPFVVVPMFWTFLIRRPLLVKVLSLIVITSMPLFAAHYYVFRQAISFS